jgi:hypothetical protein
MNSDIGELHEARFTGTFTVTAVKSINLSTGMRKVLSNCIEYITMRWTIFGCMHYASHAYNVRFNPTKAQTVLDVRADRM